MCVGRVGGAHTRQPVATAGVVLFKGGAGAGPRVERSEPFVPVHGGGVGAAEAHGGGGGGGGANEAHGGGGLVRGRGLALTRHMGGMGFGANEAHGGGGGWH